MYFISSLVLSRARSAVDIVQEQIKTQSEQLTKQIEASIGMRRQLAAPPASQSVVGGLNLTTEICLPLSLSLGVEHPGTIIRRSKRLAAKTGARRYDNGAPVEGAEPPGYGWNFRTHKSVTAPILDLPPRPRTYSERRGMGVTSPLSFSPRKN